MAGAGTAAPGAVGRRIAAAPPPTTGATSLASAWCSSRSQLAAHSGFAFELKRSKNKVEESGSKGRSAAHLNRAGGHEPQKGSLEAAGFFLFLSHRPRTTQAFKICKPIVDDYKNYLNSFTNVMDSRIHDKVQEAFETGAYLPAPFSLLHPYFPSDI